MATLEGKAAIVTGASKGIGAGIAKALAAAGASVVINYATDQDGARQVVEAIRGSGGQAIAVRGDISRAEDVQRLFEETRRAYGRLDVLVNNAGVFRFAPLEDVTEDEFHREFNTNVLGIILATREALKYFGSGGGSVINISSITSFNPAPASVIYSATKSAVDSITRTLARELGPKKVRVNCISPGGVDTEGSRTLGLIGSDFGNDMVGKTPLGRLGQPEDIAPIAVFLASPDSGWLTGEILVASGGYR